MASFFRSPTTIPKIYPILDTATLDRRKLSPLKAAEALLEAGARILQYRHKSFWSREAFAQAKQIAKLCHESQATFIINDRADYTRLLADLNVGLSVGLHIGQEDLLPADARNVIGPAPIIGFSTHNLNQMQSAITNPIGPSIDYIAFGPVFQTTSKDHPDPTVGIETLRAIRPLTSKPMVAIGGITRDNASNCLNAGADSVAIIADLFPDPCTKRALRERMTEWCRISNP